MGYPMDICNKYRDMISEKIDGEEVNIADLDNHLSNCPECRKFELDMAKIKSSLKSLPDFKLSENFNAVLMQKIGAAVYQQPGAELLIKSHKTLEKLVCTREENKFKHAVDEEWAYLVYGAEWFSLLKKDLDAQINAFTYSFHNIRLIPNVSFDSFDILINFEIIPIVLNTLLIVSEQFGPHKIIEHNNFVASLRIILGSMTADHSRPAGDKNSHVNPPYKGVRPLLEAGVRPPCP